MSVLLTNKIIIKDWIDYNGHMNLSYYILVFDMGAEVILSKFQMGEQAAKTTKRSTMVVETHTNYIKEVKENDEVIISLSHIDHDKKRPLFISGLLICNINCKQLKQLALLNRLFQPIL